MNKDSGQGLVEFTISLPLVMGFCSCFLLLSYFFFAKLWLGQQTYLAALCLAQKQTKTFCVKQTHASINRFLPWGQILRLDLRKTSHAWQGEVSWEFLQQYIHERALIHR